MMTYFMMLIHKYVLIYVLTIYLNINTQYNRGSTREHRRNEVRKTTNNIYNYIIHVQFNIGEKQ